MALFVALPMMTGQTQVDPIQVRSRVTVLEWSSCNFPPSDGGRVNCAGIQFMRIRRADNTVKTYIVTPSTPEIDAVVKDWTPEPL